MEQSKERGTDYLNSKTKFCRECGALLTKESAFVLKCDAEHYTYRNATLSNNALIVRDDKVLIARRAIEPYKGQYDLVGGFVDWGEIPEEAMLRELCEESGLEAESIALFGLYGAEHPADVYPVSAAYIVEIAADAEPTPMDDVASLDWYGFDEIPAKAEWAFESCYNSLIDFAKSRGYELNP